MAIIRCTQKLLKELKIDRVEVPVASTPVSNWHANMLLIYRRKCVLFTNDQTLYSFLVLALKKQQFKNFLKVFRLNLFRNLMSENLPERQIEYLLQDHREIMIAKTNNRSVLGSMNELAIAAKAIIYVMWGRNGVDMMKLNHELNRIPMGAIGYQDAISEIKRRLCEIA